MFAELPESNGVVQVTIHGLYRSNSTILALAQFFQYFPNVQQLEKPFMPEIVLGAPIENFVTEFGQLEHLRLLRIQSQALLNGKRFVAMVLKNLTNLQHLEYYEVQDVLYSARGYCELAESLKHFSKGSQILPIQMENRF